MPTNALSNRAPRYYPSQLELFHDCRRRFSLKVVERRRITEPFSPPLGKGNATHEALKVCGARLKANSSLPADLRPLIAARLPRSEYATEASWEYDISEVVEWVMYGLSYIDPGASILGVELFLERTFRPEFRDSPISLGAVVDLLLLRTDSDGNRFLEIVDYKTGKLVKELNFAPVMTRFVLKQLIKAHVSGTDFAPVLFTELYLGRRTPRTQELTLPMCLAGWEEILNTVAAIEKEAGWDPTPSPLCQWCPFNGNGCNPDSTEDEVLW